MQFYFELNGDVHEDWQSFKNIFELMDLYIPKIKIDGICQPSWFDAETHQLCRKKGKFHQKFKSTDDPDLRLSKYLHFLRPERNLKILFRKRRISVFRMTKTMASLSAIRTLIYFI